MFFDRSKEKTYVTKTSLKTYFSNDVKKEIKSLFEIVREFNKKNNDINEETVKYEIILTEKIEELASEIHGPLQKALNSEDLKGESQKILIEKALNLTSLVIKKSSLISRKEKINLEYVKEMPLLIERLLVFLGKQKLLVEDKLKELTLQYEAEILSYELTGKQLNTDLLKNFTSFMEVSIEMLASFQLSLNDGLEYFSELVAKYRNIRDEYIRLGNEVKRSDKSFQMSELSFEAYQLYPTIKEVLINVPEDVKTKLATFFNNLKKNLANQNILKEERISTEKNYLSDQRDYLNNKIVKIDNKIEYLLKLKHQIKLENTASSVDCNNGVSVLKLSS